MSDDQLRRELQKRDEARESLWEREDRIREMTCWADEEAELQQIAREREGHRAQLHD